MDDLANIIAIIADQAGLDESDIPADAALQDLGIDSLDELDLLMTFEEEYNLEISDSDWQSQCRTADALARYIEERNKA
jgi:acyl carrier protein